MSETTPIIIKKKKVQAAAHHGGSWKVAYADFVTAMMAFFMVMWIMGMSAETRSMVAGYFNDPMGFVKNPPKSKSVFSLPGNPNPKPSSGEGATDSEAAQEELQLKKVKENVKQALTADMDLKELEKHIEVTLEEEGLRIELVESAGAVFFETGRDVIRPVALKLISKIGPVLGQSGRPIVVEGHTDAKPYAGTDYNNWDLSADRASALRRALSHRGVSNKQFVSVSGFADTRLKNPSDPYHFSNRRVTLLLPFKRVIQKVENLPGEQLRKEIQGVFKQNFGSVAPKPHIPREEQNAFGEAPSKER